MAQPRVFISSTCYDLQEIRYQLRSFIGDFGFEPVMSEFGDIFFDYLIHIQDSCKGEIEKCQLFVLIIGNSFGSTYYRQKEGTKSPDSVTMQEFKRSIEVNTYKHIFINKFVEYDYKNYQRALTKEITKSIENIDELIDDVDNIVLSAKKEFTNRYPFPQDSYKYIFNFLDIIYSLKTNNAIIPYESFDDIKTSLRKQWAGFMYDTITNNKTIPINALDRVIEKIDKVENQIRTLIESQVNKQDNDSKITFDISRLTNEINSEDISKIKEELHSKIFNLLYVDEGEFQQEYNQRVIFRSLITTENIEKWLSLLESRVKQYKWAKSLPSTIVFKGIGVIFSYYPNQQEIPYDLILSFYNLYSNIKTSFTKEDYEALLILSADKFNKLYEPKPDPEPDPEPEQGDGLPF